MDRGFCINFRHSAGNLHIKLSGEFSGVCAWELMKIIIRQHTGSGRIFVNTTGIDRVMPAGADIFKSNMTHSKIPAHWMYFKGEKGFEIAPDGSRVMVCKTHSNRQRFPLRALKP